MMFAKTILIIMKNMKSIEKIIKSVVDETLKNLRETR